MILLTQSGYDPGRDILARCAAVSASVGAPAPMVHLLPAEAAEAPARSETYIEQVYHITQTLETNYLVNLQMDLRFLTLKLDGALRQLARVEQDAARMHASAPKSAGREQQGKAAAPVAGGPEPHSAPARAALSSARPLAMLDLARTRALEPLETSVLRAQENRERVGSQPRSAERVLLSAQPAAPVQDASVQRAQHPASAPQPARPAASEEPAAPSRPAAPAQTVLRSETPFAPPRPAAVHSGTPAQTDERRDERSTDLKLPVSPISAARNIRTAQTALPAEEAALRAKTASPAFPAQNPAVPNTAAAQTLPATRPLAPVPTVLRTESAQTAEHGTPKASSAAPAQTMHAAPPAQTVSRAEPAQSAQPSRAQSRPSAPAPLGAQAAAPLAQRRPLGHFEPQEGQETAAPPAYAPVPGRMAADRVLRRDAAAQEQSQTQVSRTTQTPQTAHSSQAARTASNVIPAHRQVSPAQTAPPAQPIAAPAPLVYAQPHPAGEPPEVPSAAVQTAAPAHSASTASPAPFVHPQAAAPAPLVHAQLNPPAAAARNVSAPPQTSPRDFARQVSGKYAAAPDSPAVRTALTPRAGIAAAQAAQSSASAGTMARANAPSAVPAAFTGPAAMELRRETASAAPSAEQAEENDIKTVRRTRTVKQETLPAGVKTAVNASGAQLPAAAAPVRVAPAEVERIADKVYRQIEARLRSEKARRGM